MIRLVAMLWAAAALIPSQDPTTSEELPAIRPIQGDLHLWNAAKDKLTPVTELVRVNPKDRIGTRKDKLGLFATQDGSLISLSEVEVAHDRGLALERTKDKLVIKLYKGKILLDAYQSGFRVETPNGVVEGDRGCSVIQVDGVKTKVWVLAEKLTFVSPLGKVTLEGGQESTAERGTRPSDPKPTDVDKATGEFSGLTSPGNLVKNPGFEDGLKDWAIDSPKGVSLDNAVSHSGRNCVRLELSDRMAGSGGRGWLGFKQNLGLIPGRRYVVRAYLRQEIRSGSVKAYLSIEAQGGTKWTADPSEKGWVRVGGVYTAPSGGFRISVEALIESEHYDAVIWADDFLITELK
jgi:hypothetical protein